MRRLYIVWANKYQCQTHNTGRCPSFLLDVYRRKLEGASDRSLKTNSIRGDAWYEFDDDEEVVEFKLRYWDEVMKRL